MLSAEELREKVVEEVRRIQNGLSHPSKAVHRELHEPAVRFQLHQHQSWLRWAYPKYCHFFSNGNELDPRKVDPRLIEVTELWHERLYRLARLTWSLPYTRGYGRRLRFLIMDASNEKLIGLIALQSPPLDFPARDRIFKYPEGRKVELVNQTMDIYTLGAVPPYNRLLGGKLVALAAVSREVREAYRQKYEGKRTELEQRALPAQLIALTTTSAFGRSSIYNRLTYRSRTIAHRIGYTEGYGSFHFATLYPLLRDFLKVSGIEPPSGYGSGPRAVWQTCTTAFRVLGLPRDLLKHGVRREAFLFPLVSNLEDYIEGRTDDLDYYDDSFTELAHWWRERWLLPRAERVDGWHQWERDSIRKIIMLEDQANA